MNLDKSVSYFNSCVFVNRTGCFLFSWGRGGGRVTSCHYGKVLLFGCLVKSDVVVRYNCLQNCSLAVHSCLLSKWSMKLGLVIWVLRVVYEVGSGYLGFTCDV